MRWLSAVNNAIKELVHFIIKINNSNLYYSIFDILVEVYVSSFDEDKNDVNVEEFLTEKCKRIAAHQVVDQPMQTTLS